MKFPLEEKLFFIKNIFPPATHLEPRGTLERCERRHPVRNNCWQRSAVDCLFRPTNLLHQDLARCWDSSGREEPSRSFQCWREFFRWVRRCIPAGVNRKYGEMSIAIMEMFPTLMFARHRQTFITIFLWKSIQHPRFIHSFTSRRLLAWITLSQVEWISMFVIRFMSFAYKFKIWSDGKISGIFNHSNCRKNYIHHVVKLPIRLKLQFYKCCCSFGVHII